ncbi:ATPase (AAA+ superfamily) [sediment metagenome]|uniref:ATPase (AAA+ superfamily) n=1 Tax=sediment metagenome TaxID=749907 RepID=D9PJC0_9ZZZZ
MAKKEDIIIKREIEDDIVKWLDSKEIIGIRGTRQCGKTTFLTRIIEILSKKKIKKENIHFINFEDDFEKEKFEKNPKDYINFFIKSNESKHYFLLDEVQYIKQAGKILKLIYDEIKNIKIIITGSSTLDLNEIGSFLVGRVLLFEMYPFSFAEFLKAKNERLYSYYLKKKVEFKNNDIKIEEIIFINELNNYLREYITYGGYPAVVIEEDIEKKKFLLKNLFLTYIEKDIVKVYGLRYKQRISDLIKYLSSINTSMINYNEIAGLTRIYEKELKEIFNILESTYVIKLIRPYHKNLSTELKKNPKVFFIDSGLRNIISGRFEFSDEEYGKLFENYVFCKIKQKNVNYWRTTAKAEVDFVLDQKIPIEVKLNPKITRSFRSFINTYKPEIGFVVNIKEFNKLKINSTKIYVVPGSILI